MQLNFLQHIARSLPIGGRAAVFVPDNVLVGLGSDLTVRRALLEECDVHTLLRLPTGVFARGGVKTNVVFFDKVRPRADGAAATSQVWIYDFRSGLHFAARNRPLTRPDLDDFVTAFAHGDPRENRTATDSFKSVRYDQLAAREFNLDILWRNDDSSEETRNPKDIALEIVDELSAALEEFKALADELPDNPIRVDS
jgi:type I restriction enzyme M protein